MGKIYNFTDTLKRATPGELPGEALFINGEAIENLIEGYRTLYVKGRESMSAEIALMEQGKADGSLFNYKRYPERVITVGFQIIAATNEKYRFAFNLLGGILNVTEAQLIFNDELDKFYIGTPGEIDEIEPGANKIVGEFNIVCATPFKYSVEEKSVSVPARTSATEKTFLYNGTVPTRPRIESVLHSDTMHGTPWGAATWFEYYQLNESVLSFTGGSREASEIATLTTPTSGTSGSWTRYNSTQTFESSLYQAMCEGKFTLSSNSPTNCYRLRAILTLGNNPNNYSPSIEVIRDYSNGIPRAELRFKVGDTVVYSEYIEDDKETYPFRISHEHSAVLASTRLGYMLSTVTYQFGDFIYTHKFSVPYSSSSSTELMNVTGAEIEYARYYMSTGTVGGSGSMTVIDATVYNNDAPFLYDVPHVVDVENAKLYINDLYTPYPNIPANDWDGFELVPGENTARCASFGIASGYFSAVYKWREVFV